MTSYLRGYSMAFSAHQKPTVGDMKFSAAQYDHLGWLLCNGTSLDVSKYQFLFNVIGYSFGGSGAQFNLPNPAGRVPGVIGTGTDSNTSNLTIARGDKIGEYQHQLTIPEMPTHNHGVTDPGHTHSINNPMTVQKNTTNTTTELDNENSAEINLVDTLAASNNFSTTGITINNTGSSLYHNNIQPTIGMGNMFIYCGLLQAGSYPYTTGKNLW